MRVPPKPKTLFLTGDDQIVTALVALGVREDKARNVLMTLPDGHLAMDQIEWAEAEIQRKAKTSAAIKNPAGFVLYVLQANHPVPAAFLSTRRRRLMAEVHEQVEKERALEAQRELEQYEWKERYEELLTQNTEAHIATQMPGDLLKRRLGVMRKKILQTNTLAKGWPTQVIDEYAHRMLREELARDLDLPTFEDFYKQAQTQLF